MTRAMTLIRAALIVLFVGAIALGGGLFWSLGKQVEKVSVVDQSDPLWVASQLQYEMLRLKNSILNFASGDVQSFDVSMRFDIAWSRVNILQTKGLAQLLEATDSDSDLITSIEETFRAIEPTILALSTFENAPVERRENAAALLASLRPYDTSIRDFTIGLAQAKAQKISAFRDGAFSLSRIIAFVFAAIIGLAAIFLVFLIIDLRASRATASKLEKLAEQAASASVAKDQFMSAVSHELRTPLTSILGGIRLLKTGSERMSVEQSVSILDIADRNCERLLTLVNDILDSQRILEGRVTLNRECGDISDVIRTTVEDCQAYGAQLNVSYVTEIHDDALHVLMDKDKISQVIFNLLSNAAKFTTSGDQIIVRAFKDGNFVRVEVEDHGIGIAESEHEKLFTRFHQIDPVESGLNKSSGLGLCISKQIVEMHSGEIWFTSSPGKGSTFWFTLRSEASVSMMNEATQVGVDVSEPVAVPGGGEALVAGARKIA